MTPPRPRPLAGTVLGLVLGLGAAHGQQGNPGAADVRAVGLTVEQLVPGAWIEARGRLTAPARLVADAVHASVPGRGEIVGPVTAEERRTDGSIVLAVLGVDVVVPVGAPTYGTDLARR